MGMSVFKQLSDWAIDMINENRVEEAINELNSKISQGNAEAYGVLGAFYIYGVGVYPDINRGMDLLATSVNMGCGDAAYELANFYHGADNMINRDSQKEMFYLEKGAQLGNSKCCVPLSYNYLFGDGVPKDEYKGCHYAQIAAEDGNPDGMMNYGICFMEGLGTNKNPYEAAKWFRNALNYYPDDENAILNMVICLADPYELYGIVPSQDMLQEAFYYCGKAVEKGNIEAHLICAWFYEEGKVVPQDFETAHKFTQIAADNGNEFAREHLKAFMKNIYGQYYIPNY